MVMYVQLVEHHNMVRTKASIDRIENGLAVLILNNKNTDQVIIPMSIMPQGANESDVVAINISRDKEETAIVKRRVSELLKELTRDN